MLILRRALNRQESQGKEAQMQEIPQRAEPANSVVALTS